ncbi:hypothetical protein [Salipiger sp.]|uniref:hypothetical protein n=1 Tax=Salipiger sp. TaxID=2078585 RepID=UPI003A972ED7
MPVFPKSTAALFACFVASSPAFAEGDMYRGDATSDPAREPLVQAYPAANYCPAGRQPVISGGVIYCGVPTDASGLAPEPAPAPAPRRVFRAATPPPPPVDDSIYLPRPYVIADEY